MRKYELSLSPEYVANWTVVDAVRELFQNAIDEQALSPDNVMTFGFSGDALWISNERSQLNVSSLLLGMSSKRGETTTIGKFGEGYKIAALVLSRLGKRVIFHNYSAGERWKPRFVNSKRYGVPVLTFFIEDIKTLSKLDKGGLMVEVQNITQEEWEDIQLSNLHTRDIFEWEDTEFGRILLDEKFAGRIYVNGLFICEYKPYKYGYDFKPAHIRIDRDRKLVSDFDLQWLSSRMWGSVASDRTIELIAQGAADVKYVKNAIGYGNEQRLANKALEQFKVEFGADAVPVTTQEELEKVPPQYKAVIVAEQYKELITASCRYEAPPEEPELTIRERFEEWFEAHLRTSDLLCAYPQIEDEFNSLLELLD